MLWVTIGVWVVTLVFFALLTWIAAVDFGRKAARQFAALSFFWIFLGVVVVYILERK